MRATCCPAMALSRPNKNAEVGNLREQDQNVLASGCMSHTVSDRHHRARLKQKAEKARDLDPELWR